MNVGSSLENMYKNVMFKTCENLRCTATDWQIRFPINLLNLLINDCDTVAKCAIQINYVYFHYDVIFQPYWHIKELYFTRVSNKCCLLKRTDS